MPSRKVFHSSGPNRRTPPSGSFESRTATTAGRLVATSTQLLLVGELWLLLRQMARGRQPEPDEVIRSPFRAVGQVISSARRAIRLADSRALSAEARKWSNTRL
jgi:hypothetical protein